MYLTIFLIATTSLVSVLAFNNMEMFNKLKFNAYLIWHKKDYVRMFSHALVHGGWFHLIINMYVLWIFGSAVEKTFSDSIFFPQTHSLGKFFFVLMYVLAVPISTVPALLKHKNDHYYNSVGASGAVSAIVFTTILLAPDMRLGILFIPISMPAYIFGLLYLVYSYFMSRRGKDNIAHDAHFVGSVFGFLFPILLNPNLFHSFINQIF